MTFNPEWIIVHVTATTPSMVEVDASWVDALHRKKGYNSCGYHEVITRPGHPHGAQRQTFDRGFRCRPLDRPGAHVGGCGRGWNAKCLGISLAGGVDENIVPEDNMAPAQYELLMEAIREYQERYDIDDDHVIGHRDLIKMTHSSPKACPCFSVQKFLKGQPFGGTYRPSKRVSKSLGIPAAHRVRRGESLWGIANSYGVSVENLSEWNNIDNSSIIHAGRSLKLSPA